MWLNELNNLKYNKNSLVKYVTFEITTISYRYLTNYTDTWNPPAPSVCLPSTLTRLPVISCFNYFFLLNSLFINPFIRINLILNFTIFLLDLNRYFLGVSLHCSFGLHSFIVLKMRYTLLNQTHSWNRTTYGIHLFH